MLCFLSHSKTVWQVLLIGLLCVTVSANAQNLTGASDLSLVQSWSQEPNGWSYPVAVSVPPGEMPAQGFPVGILLHGNGVNGFQMLNLGGNLLTDHILVAPTGYLNSWNLCGENSEAPDIAMLSDLVAQLSGFDNVDANHIRLIGSSNGAGLVNQAFIELDDPGVDAFVAIVSQMNQPQFHQGAFHRPSGVTDAPLSFCGYDDVVVPPQGRKYLSICNHNDSVVPYDGGPAVGNFFLPAEFAIHQVALQQGHVGPPVPGEPLAGTGLTAFSYLEGNVVLVRGNAGHGTSPSQTMVASEFLSIEDVPPPAPSEGDCPEDLDLDGVVGVSDILILLGEFGCVVECGATDIDANGLVGVSDVLAMLNVFGMPCSDGPPVPTVMANSTYAVVVDTAIVYAEGLSHETWNSDTSMTMPLLLDAYVPQGAGDNRPAIVIIHGGAFNGGSRQQESLVAMANHFASRGWVAFSIDYRLAGDVGTVPQQWADSVLSAGLDTWPTTQSLAIYPAHRDAKAALRWVAANAENYGINMDYLTVGGGSAGATTAIGVSVTEPGDFTDELTVAEDPMLATTHLGETYEVQTILDFWGGRGSVDLWHGVYGGNRFDSGDPALFITHGTNDETVLYTNALALEATWTDMGVPYILHTLQGAGHGPWGATVPDADGNPQSLSELAFNFMVAQQALQVE